LSRRDQLPRTKVPLKKQDRDEDRGDDQDFSDPTALDTRADHEQHEDEREERAGRDDERAAPVHR